MSEVNTDGRPGAARLRPFPVADTKAVEEVRAKLAQKLAYKPRYEINFVSTQNSVVCCFDGKRLYLTDSNLRPLLTYDSSSYIHACAVSDTARYVVCQMAFNHENNADSGAMVLFDVKAMTEIARSVLPTGWKGMTHLFVDEKTERIFVYYGDMKVDYDFAFKANEKALQRYYRNCAEEQTASPYTLNSRAQELIKKAKAGETDWNAVEKEVLFLLETSGENQKMSPYQLSVTYKELGDLYAGRGEAAKAVSAYETGLSLNPKLPVKKKLNQEREKSLLR